MTHILYLNESFLVLQEYADIYICLPENILREVKNAKNLDTFVTSKLYLIPKFMAELL